MEGDKVEQQQPTTINNEAAPAACEEKKKRPSKEEKRAAKEAEKQARKQQAQQQQQAAKQLDEAFAHLTIEDVKEDKKQFGYLPLVQSRTDIPARTFTPVNKLDESLANQTVWVRARIYRSRSKGRMAFLVLRQDYYSCQVTIFADDVKVPRDMVKFAAKLNPQSIVDIEGVVTKVETKIEGCTQHDIEIQATKIFCVSESLAPLPLQIQDAEKPEPKEDEPQKEGDIRVSREVRLDNRVLDLRVPANLAIFRIQSAVGLLFREYLYSHGFVEIHTPKLIATASEGGANVFAVKYFERNAFLAQSPQLYKQMAVEGDLNRVFEIGPVFRAENSNTHRHMTEFVGLDLEMAIQNHYSEALDVISDMLVYIFEGIRTRFANELQIISQSYPFEPIKYYTDKKTLRLSFPEAVQMLREAGVDQDPLADLSTPAEKKLGELVKAKYDTDFFILDKYPAAARPFYTMPDPEDPRYSNSYDLFIRGEEISSGAQRIHDPVLLEKRARELNVDLKPIQAYVDAFKYGAWPHAGCGLGLERVVMLYLNLGNIRKSSMFPRDPKRVTP